MYKKLALLLLISTTYLQAIDRDDVRFTILFVKKTNVNPYNYESDLEPLLKMDWTIGKVRRVIAAKTDIWLSRQGKMYVHAHQPFADNNTLAQSMKGVSNAAKTTIYLEYDDTIKPTYQFIYNKKIFKTIKTPMGYPMLYTLESDLFKKLKKQRESDDVLRYTYHKKTYNARDLCKKLDSCLPFLTKDQLSNKICKIKMAIGKKSQDNQQSSLWSKIKDHKLLTGIIVAGIVITIGYLATKKKKAKKPKKNSWFEATKNKVYNALSKKK